ncbi:helix-turn-helix transcriptional regulator [Streptosporangium sp. NPDC051022]|uniref:helix-turn-helix domain-containing protein n=1 Tax=Streptosporangium sp. NPDC051022 TaxID=3155752 RepID=UPI00342B079D
MATSPSSSARQARQLIADRLREILRDSGLTARALARQAGWDETKCSRLIHARTPPSDADIRTWCTVCGVPEEIPNLIAASRNANNAYVEWRRVQRSQKRMQELRLSLYEETRLFRFYCAGVVPWPLQTPDYMRSVMTRFNDFHRASAGDIEEAVQARVARRRYLKDDTRRCAMLIEEQVLHNRFMGGDEVMLEQLRHLLTGMKQQNLSLGIIPLNRSRLQRPTETFSIYDESQVFIELVSAAVTITQPHEVALYVKCFQDLGSAAVHGDEARALIETAIGRLA